MLDPLQYKCFPILPWKLSAKILRRRKSPMYLPVTACAERSPGGSMRADDSMSSIDAEPLETANSASREGIKVE